MAAALGVRARVMVGRAVASPHLPALQTDPQMQPLTTAGQAVLAALDGFGELGDPDVIEMGT